MIYLRYIDSIVTLMEGEVMSPDENQRMIHIRIDRGVHKELRKVAAEFDLTIQEIVSDAVEEKIEDREMELKLEKKRAMLERKAKRMELKMLEKFEQFPFEIESEIETDLPEPPELDPFAEELPEAVMAKLMKIEKSIEKISIQLEELSATLGQSE